MFKHILGLCIEAVVTTVFRAVHAFQHLSFHTVTLCGDDHRVILGNKTISVKLAFLHVGLNTVQWLQTCCLQRRPNTKFNLR